MNANSHQSPNNHLVSKEDRLATDRVNDRDRSNADQIGLNGPQEESQLLQADTEKEHTPEHTVTTPDGWEEYEQDTKCGIAGYKPQWLQTLASKKSYVVVYGLVGMCQFAVGTYFVSTISTIEKRFKIPSRTSGMIQSAWDTGGLFSNIILTYLGSRGHKLRWVASGTLLVGLSCFMCLLPHLIFGPGQDALAMTVEYGASYDMAMGNSSLDKDLSEAFLCSSERKYQEDCSMGDFSSAPPAIFFVSFLVIGVGTSVYHTLGVSYLDDNVRKNKTPFLLAIWQCIRMLGPTVGFLYGSYALQMYVVPSVHPTITSDDPRWIGAWWHGWVPFGVIGLLLALVVVLFPKQLPRAAQREMAAIAAGETVITTKERSFNDFKMVLSRLTKNKVLLFNSFSTVFFVFGYIGSWTFMPKYMETQFRQSASTSSLITGSVGISFSAMGIIVSGAVMSKFKPRCRYLAAWNVIVEALDAIVHLCYGFLTCSVEDLHGEMNPDKSWNLTADCNTDCHCGPNVKYSPICAVDGSNSFFSACHAGCTSVEMINGTKMYGNCSCIGPEGMGWAVDGSCAVDCTTNFTIFLALQCIMRFCVASGRAGNTIIQFRCVADDDKSLSIGFTEALLCALAFIPGPILYGMLLDSACIAWANTCGEVGNCWIYDAQRLGYLLNFTASGFLFCGTLLDIGVWYNVKDLQIYDKETETDNTRKEKNSKKRRRREEQ